MDFSKSEEREEDMERNSLNGDGRWRRGRIEKADCLKGDRLSIYIGYAAGDRCHTGVNNAYVDDLERSMNISLKYSECHGYRSTRIDARD